jgi:hypothetical protein
MIDGSVRQARHGARGDWHERTKTMAIGGHDGLGVRGAGFVLAVAGDPPGGPGDRGTGPWLDLRDVGDRVGGGAAGGRPSSGPVDGGPAAPGAGLCDRDDFSGGAGLGMGEFAGRLVRRLRDLLGDHGAGLQPVQRVGDAAPGRPGPGVRQGAAVGDRGLDDRRLDRVGGDGGLGLDDRWRGRVRVALGRGGDLRGDLGLLPDAAAHPPWRSARAATGRSATASSWSVSRTSPSFSSRLLAST